MAIGIFPGKRVLHSRIHPTVLATLAGAVIGIPSSVSAQRLSERDFFADLRFHHVPSARANSADASWANWRSTLGSGGEWSRGRSPDWANPRGRARPERSSTDAHWAAAASGNWSDPTRWTSNPFYPNNGNPSGSTYNAFLDAIGPNHVVGLDTDVDVQSLVIDSANVEFGHGGAHRLTALNSVDLVSGLYQLSGGVLADTTLNLLGGEFIVHGSTPNVFRNMTVNGDIALKIVYSNRGGFLRVQDGLTLNGTLSMSEVMNQLVFENTQTLHSGTIRFETTQFEPSQLNVVGGQTFTIGASAAIRGGDGELGERGYSTGTPGTNAIVNDGLISADLAGQSIGIYTSSRQQAGDTFYNNGTIEAIGGGELIVKHFAGDVNTARVDGVGSKMSFDGIYTINTPIDVMNESELTLNGDWTNVAGVNVTGNSILRLGGTMSAATLGPLNTAGGNVYLLGEYANAGSTLVMDGNWKLAGGTITGGTVTKSGSALETVPGTQSTLSQLAYTGDLSIPSSTLIAQDVSLGGNTLVDDGVLELSGAWSTSGTVTANQSTLRLGGSFDYGSFGSFVRTNSPVELTGSLDLLGNTLAIDPTQGDFSIISGTVENGTIDASLGSPLTVAKNGHGTLTDITLQGEFDVTNSDATTHNLVNEGVLRLGNHATFELFGNWSSPGLIDMQSSASRSTLVLGGQFGISDLAGLTTRSNFVEIRGLMDNTAGTLTVGTTSERWWLDGGTISGGTINILRPDAFNTFGPGTSPRYLTSRLDGVAIVGDFAAEYLTFSNGVDLTGTLSLARDNASLVFDGTQSFTSGLIDAQPRSGSIHRIFIEPDSTLTLGPNATIRGGGAIIGQTTTGVGINSLTNDGTIRSDMPGESLTIASTTLTNNGTLEVRNGATMTVESELANAGTLRAATGGALHLNDMTGSVGNVDLTGFASALSLDGTYSIDNTLTVNPNTSLTLNGDWTNNGLIQMSDGELNLGGYFSASGASGFSRTGGTVNLIGTFDNTGSIFELNSTTGPWALKGGTFLGGTLELRDGVVLEATGTSTGTLDNVIIDGDVLLMSGTLVSKNGSQFTGIALFTGGELQLHGDHVFDNTTFEFAGPSGWLHTVDPLNPTTLTFGPNFIARGHDGFIGSDPASADDDTIINQGLILADQPGGPLTIQPKTFVNDGIVRATSGGAVALDVTRSASAWSNAGTLDVQSGGLMHLMGDFSTPGLGVMNRTGGEVRVSGLLDNTGSAITLSDALGDWSLQGATLNGGTVESLDNRRLGLLQGAAPNRFTGGVTVNGDLSLAAELIVSDGATFNGDVEITGGTLNFEGDQTLTSGTLLFSGPSTGFVGVTDGANPGSLTLDTGVSVLGQNGQLGALPGAVSDTIINRGLIRSDQPGGVITIKPWAFVNEGDLESSGGGTLVLDTTASPGSWTNQGRLGVEPGGLTHLKGAYTLAGLGTLDRTGGDMRLTGTLDNTGGTIHINNAVGGFDLDGGEIVGGAIDMKDGQGLGLLLTGAGENRLSGGVTIDGVWTLDSSPWITDGLTVNGTLRLDDHALMIEGTQTFESGVFDFESSGSSSFAIRSTGERPILTLALGVVVHGGEGTLGSFNPNYDDGIINHGLISSDAPGKELRINSDVFDNQGIVEARNGATMRIGHDESNYREMSWTNSGILRADGGTLRLGGQFTTADLGTIENVNGGTVILSGTLDNNNALLSIDTPGQQWRSWGSILGGAVEVAPGTPMSFSGHLDGVSLTGDVESSYARIHNGLALDGSITLAEPNSKLTFEGSQRFDAGSIMMSGPTGFRELMLADHTTLTLGPAATISGGAGRIGAVGSSTPQTHLVNEGTIRADIAGAELTVAPHLFDNRGELAVTNGATLILGKSGVNPTATNNFGLIEVSDGLLDIGGTFSQLGGTIHQTGGQIQLSGTMQNSLSTFTLDGPNAKFNLDGTIVEGAINVLNGAEFAIAERDHGILDGVQATGMFQLQGGSTRNASLSFINGVTLNGGVNVTGEKALLRFMNISELAGGTLFFDGDSNSVQELQIDDGSTFTLGSSAIIHGGGATIAKSLTGTPITLVNQGLIQANKANAPLSVLPNVFSNTGVLEAAGGGTLIVGRPTTPWSSTGILRSSGGRLVLDGSFASSSLAGLENLGGNVWLAGDLDNVGSTLTLDSTTGTLELDQGTITGGTIVQSQGAQLGLALIPGFGHSSGELVDVSLMGDLNMPYVNGAWNIVGDFDHNGDVVIGGRNNSIDFNRRELDNTTIHLNGTGLEGNRIHNLDIGPGAVVRGGRAGINGIEYNRGLVSADRPFTSLGLGGTEYFINEGTLEVLQDATLSVGARRWRNTGTIRVQEGSLSLHGAFAAKDIAGLERTGGLVTIFGEVDNSENTWALQPGPWEMRHFSSIKGGTVEVSTSSSLMFGNGETTLTDVSIEGNVFMSEEDATLLIEGNLGLVGTLAMSAPETRLRFARDGILTRGTVHFDGERGGIRKMEATNNKTLTIDETSTVHGGNAEIWTGATSTVINKGLISADTAGQAITIYTTRFENLGTLEAINGGELILIEAPDQIGPMPTAPLYNDGLLNLGFDSRIAVGGFVQGESGVAALNILADNGIALSSHMHVSGPAWLDGALQVQMTGTPRFGDEFRLFGWSGVNGEFDTVSLPGLPGSLTWDATQLYRSGVIQVIPSPASITLLAGAGVFAVLGRRRISKRAE